MAYKPLTDQEVNELNAMFQDDPLLAFNATERLLRGVAERLNYLVSDLAKEGEEDLVLEKLQAIDNQLAVIKPDTSAIRNAINRIEGQNDTIIALLSAIAVNTGNS